MELLAGRRHVHVTASRTKQDWARFIRALVDVRYPDAERVVLVLDNLNMHGRASFYEAFPPAEPRWLVASSSITPHPAGVGSLVQGEQPPVAAHIVDGHAPDGPILPIGGARAARGRVCAPGRRSG